MDKQEHIDHWLSSASDDLLAAENLLKAGNYNWCLFIGHLVIEKTLKAIFVKTNFDMSPPKTHDLIKLAKKCNIKLTDEKLFFLSKVNDFNIEARYSEYKSNFNKICNESFATENLNKIKDHYQWLLSLLK